MRTIFVLTNKDNPQLRLLADLPSDIRIIIGERAEDAKPFAADIDAVLAWSGSMGGSKGDLPKLLENAPNIKWIHSRWAGMDSMLFPELIQSSIVVTNARGVFAESLAEFALGAVLYFAKDFSRMKRNQRAQLWEPFDVEMISGKTVGIFGYGEIGAACARKCSPLGMKILASRRNPLKAKGDAHVTQFYPPEELPRLCAASDYFILAAPLTPETRKRIDVEMLKHFKRHTVIINIGRGAVIDEVALIEALKNNSIRGAALDVFEKEPLPSEHPLYSLENVLLSPHTADHTDTWQDDAMRCFVDNAIRFSRGEPLKNVVDNKLGY